MYLGLVVERDASLHATLNGGVLSHKLAGFYLCLAALDLPLVNGINRLKLVDRSFKPGNLFLLFGNIRRNLLLHRNIPLLHKLAINLRRASKQVSTTGFDVTSQQVAHIPFRATHRS